MAKAFNDANCNPSGESIVKKIVLRVADTFFEEQKHRASPKNGECVGQRDFSKKKLKQALKLLNNLVTNDGAVSHSSGEASQRFDGLLAIGSLFPVSRDIINNIGGKKVVQNVIEAHESDISGKANFLLSFCQYYYKYLNH
ncbi:hypothetical protein DPMN_095111 [Dreissena polymorpha]|uniref:Uncharacterized protein n=1 Tax=Dreissena polymorpha TaxID=45954 RepID=A0A9D4R2J6_DREPO|nr:hypothetical protein DPMN_095111 [Dreissena polymorpha]